MNTLSSPPLIRSSRFPAPHVLELTEYAPQRLERDALPFTLGERLWRDYGKQVSVEFPSPRTGGQWQLTARGWAGYIPLSSRLHLWLRPKVPIHNLFGMWEYAYDLPMQWLKGLSHCRSIEEFHESLAVVLARRVLQRVRQGVYRSYVPHAESLPYVRGRLDAHTMIMKPGSAKLPCRYHRATADLEENQILLWTLWTIARGALCSQRALPLVRQAYHALEYEVSLRPYQAAQCVGRTYDRLNSDYEALHALCRFFLEGSGPDHESGSDAMLPFLVDMERLFELFVACWLRCHLPGDMKLRAQERVLLSREDNLAFRIDIVLSDKQSGKVIGVLDTKYKADSQPLASDIAQVVAYAEAKQCGQAVLVYPTRLRKALTVQVGDVCVRSMKFDLRADLEQAGQNFIGKLLQLK